MKSKNRKYVIDRNSGALPKTITIPNMIIAKNLENNKYRKRMRIGILLHLYRNKINPRTYLESLDLDAVKCTSFYFNVVILDKYNKNTIIDMLVPAIIYKLKKFHKRIEYFWEYYEDGYSIIECVRTKL